MKLTSDEHRALSFIAALLLLSAAVRLLALPDPVDVEGGAMDLAAHIEAVEEAVAGKEAMERPLEPGETVDPNTASPAALVRLPRVGPALAARIVADRDANGRFRTLDDLGRVPGIGPKTLEVLAPHVGLRPAPPGTSADGSGRETAAPSARSGGRAPGTERGFSRPTGTPTLDINRASAEELITLPGIGPVLAARIVAYRDSVGRFDAVSTLVEVKGIGPATLARIAELVVAR
ncbi:MAG: helix-hairpin-helix domain-containing protein [Longimicrobiales bacterium]|nr:helix-hairpin-helix domain-containing protein [Longimicrobiales bacterium]